MSAAEVRQHRVDLALHDAEHGRRVLTLHHITKAGICSCRKGAACSKPGKHPRWHEDLLPNGVHSATSDPVAICALFEEFPEANLGWAAGKESGFVAVDVDGALGNATLTRLETTYGPLPHTPRSLSGGGGEHLLFEYTPGLHNAVKFAAGLDIRTDGGLIVVRDSRHISGGTYRFDPVAHPDDLPLAPMPDWLIALVRAAGEAARSRPTAPPGEKVPEGGRNAHLFGQAVELHRRKVEGIALLGALLALNKAHCQPPLDDAEIAEIAEKAARHRERNRDRAKANDPPLPSEAPPEPSRNGHSSEAKSEKLAISVASVAPLMTRAPEEECEEEEEGPPDVLAPEAYYGLPGEVVRTIEPHTEGHPAAVLVSFLTTAGLLIGPGPYVYRDAARQRVNENSLLLGPTAAGRKGTAGRRADEVFRSLYDFDSTKGVAQALGLDYRKLILSGLGSGEALTADLADNDADPRRLVFESEFARPLKVMRREHSILSEVLRAAWDGEPLSNVTKGKKLVVPEHHVCILGHITEREMREQLASTDVFNGFGNRFLWIYTRRTKYLPFGGGRPNLAPIVSTLHKTLEYAQTIKEVEFDEDVRKLWGGERGLYRRLTTRPDNLFGAVTSRADTHVTRLALLWAILDAKEVIGIPHLLAALALWDYSERTCRYFFGDLTGIDMADRIEEMLMEMYPGGLTRKEIRDGFNRHAKPGSIEGALKFLRRQKRARKSMLPGSGRYAEMWTATPRVIRGATDATDMPDSVLQQARDGAKRLGY